MSEEAKEVTVEGAEDGVTMLDVLEEEEALEDDAAAVLGNVSDSSCTYSLGYLPRQPLYACKDCSETGVPAGVCLGCSYHCHEGHNLVELYTKRNFRCDCGLSKMKMKGSCKLEPVKETNPKNRYNQNFSGVYCTCHRPYPDPEDSVEDCMIQCVVCEDWYHGRHLTGHQANGTATDQVPAKDTTTGTTDQLPAEDTYAEMVCPDCINRLEFLHSYRGLAVTKVEKDKDKEVKVDVTDSKDDVKDAAKDEKVNTQDSSEECKLKKSKDDGALVRGAMFLPENWRKSLCRCPDCDQLYQDLNVGFLTSLEDTVYHYEAQAKVERKNSFESGMEALGSMDRVKQVEAIQGYNNMKANLMEYLSKFADNKKVVREEDIKEFFQNMTNKKQRFN